MRKNEKSEVRRLSIKQKMMREKDNGITLVALVITVIIIIILATVTLNFTFGEDGIITKANQAKYMAELSTFQEELGLYKANKQISEEGFSAESITAGEGNLSYVTDDGIVTEGTIYDVITSLRGSSFAGKMEIIKGELLINSQDMEEIRVAQSMGIQVNPYIIIDGELKSDGANLALMDSSGTLTIPDGVTTIGEEAFADLSGLKTIIIPGTVKEIKQNAFKNNADLERVVIREGVEIIGTNAFQYCSKIKNIELPESLTEIGAQVFWGCSNLTEVKIPSKINLIASHTFANCTNLTTVELPEGLETIGKRAFFNCNLKQINLSKNLKSIGEDAFGQNLNLTTIKIAEGNEVYEFDETRGMLMENNFTTQEKNIVYITDMALKQNNTLDIPEGVTGILAYLDRYNIQTVKIPSTLKNISTRSLPTGIINMEVDPNNNYYLAEDKCLYTKDKKSLIMCYTNEETVNLPEGLETIESFAFNHVRNVKIINIPNSVLTIKNYAIANSYIEKITLGDMVESIDPLFKGTNFSTEVEISNNNPNYTIENNVLYNKDKTKLIAVLYEIHEKYIVEGQVKTIGFYAFYGQAKMTDIGLSNTLIELEGNAFANCNGLTDIYIPENVQKIGANCFDQMNNLSKIQIDKEFGTISGSPWGAIRGERIVEWLK